jgi:CRISPR-associated protein (TIGR02584 family)
MPPALIAPVRAQAATDRLPSPWAPSQTRRPDSVRKESMPATANHHPADFPRRILLMVTGRTPQVVTETLFALAVAPPEGQRPFVPTEVRIITTAEGAKDARLALLSDDPGWFHALRRDYGLPEIAFTSAHIEALEDADDQPLADIRTRDHNDRAADRIVQRVRQLTADDDAALHVSLAGGRKTMGYFLGYALSLFGRSQDRLSHVLVSAPYESNRDFYYPTPYPKVIYTFGATPTQQRPIDAQNAVVTLAEIPFVRLRDHLPGQLKILHQDNASFSAVVAAMQQALEPPQVVVDLPRGGLRLAGEKLVPLAAADLAFYAWLARRRLAGRPPVRIPAREQKQWTPEQRAEYADYRREYLLEAERANVRSNVGADMRVANAMTYRFFHDRKTGVAETLEEAVGPLAEPYSIRAVAPGRPAGYGLAIEPGRIEIVDDGLG